MTRYGNPFHDTLLEIQHNEEHLDRLHAERQEQVALEVERRKREKQNINKPITRHEALLAGLLRVDDLDDEELRTGRCRDEYGRIPRGRNQLIPRHIHEAIVAEHFQRVNEKLRTQMDVALGTMVDVMLDDTVEPKDRFEAAKYLFERVAGKTPDRVQVQVSKAPWEDVMGGIARISRAESRALRSGEVIDAETVEPQADSPGGSPGDHIPTCDPPSEPDEAGFTPPSGDEKAAPSSAPYAPSSGLPGGVPPEAEPVPHHNAPQNNSATAPLVTSAGQLASNAEMIRDDNEAAADVAARRKAARKRINDAKKRRAIARATGQDAKRHKDIEATEKDGRIQFRID